VSSHHSIELSNQPPYQSFIKSDLLLLIVWRFGLPREPKEREQQDDRMVRCPSAGALRHGSLVMDEVMLLHPLKSELNYPMDDKHALDLSPKLWDLPFFLLGL